MVKSDHLTIKDQSKAESMFPSESAVEPSSNNVHLIEKNIASKIGPYTIELFLACTPSLLKAEVSCDERFFRLNE